MKRKSVPLILSLLVAVIATGNAQTQQPADERPRSLAQTQFPATPGIPQVRLPAAQESADLRVLVGRSLVVNSPAPLRRVSVSDPTIASAVVISPNQVLINGLTAGTVTLLLWDEREQPQAYDLSVEIDLSTLRETFSQVFPRENIQVEQSGASVVLVGTVSSKEVVDRAALLAATQAQAKGVVNLLVIAADPSGEVLLQVRFAEVDRIAIQNLGINIFSTGAGNTPGAISTGQFGPPTFSGDVTGRIPGTIPGTTTTFTLTDLLNVFVFRPDLNLGVTIRALQQRSLLQILAEPNLLAINGKEASFLAGGEFPFPVVQGGANVGAVTIQFREFGVRLKFTPTILPDGKIRLKVAPEVSTLDFANGINISGFLVPALSTRRAETEIELGDGQSFAIAGLIDNRLTDIASKVPVLGDIPIIGYLFKSRGQTRNNTELLVMVTPKLVRPLSPGQVPPMPTFPRPFLDREKFDGRTGEAPSKKNN